MTDRASGCDRSIAITSGASTLSQARPMTVGALRILTLIDEHTRECLALRVARRINAFGVIETLADAMLPARHPGARSLRQRPGDGRQGAAPMGRQDSARRSFTSSRASLGEWLLRELQRQTEGRVPQAGDLLLS